MSSHRITKKLGRRRLLMTGIGVGLSLPVVPLFLAAKPASALGATRYFTATGAGRNSGEDWQNAMRLAALPKSLSTATPGGIFAIAAEPGTNAAIPLDKAQIAIKASGVPGNPIILDASGAAEPGLVQPVFQSSKPWSVAGISGKKNASAYIALIQGASHLHFTGFRAQGTSPDGLFKFRGGKEGATEFVDVMISNCKAADIGRLIETDRQAFLKDLVVENCHAKGIVRGFARFYNLANGTFRNLELDAANLDGGGKNVCQIISISRGENLLFEDVVLKNALNEKWREDGTPSYFQGDGIVCERGTKNLTIRRCFGSGMGDAAFDLKTTDVTMEDSGSDSCKFGARFWTESNNVVRRCTFRNPVKQGNVNGACIQASGTLTIEESTLEARGSGAALMLHRLKKGRPPHIRMTGGEITLHENAPLARSSAEGILELVDVRVNGTLRSGRFELNKNELR